jgi:hypothetical protein
MKWVQAAFPQAVLIALFSGLDNTGTDKQQWQ